MKPRSGLGKGLEALIPQMAQDFNDEIVHISLSDLKPNPYQPRNIFNEDKLEELVSSIREHGVIQPIVVRKRVAGGYEIIAGERRYRASLRLNLDSIPAIVKEFSDKDAMEIALIENLQREDLNPIELAEAYSKYMDLFSLTQEQIADRVGLSRSHVANYLRLLNLPADVRDDVSRGTISMGHAKVLLSLNNQSVLYQIISRIKSEDLSVRDTEALVSNAINVPRETKSDKKDSKIAIVNPQIKSIEEEMREILGTQVRVKDKRGKGKIEIDYYDENDLTRIISILKQEG